MYFLPEPQGHASLRPTFWPSAARGSVRVAAARGAPSPCSPPRVSCHSGARWATRVVGASSWVMRTLKSCSTAVSFRLPIISWNMSKASFLYSVSGSRWPYPRSPMPSFR